jgi:aspartyl-tRNA(Asn)/glutamyl-tRNA(Gln) amidotransferase subunit A
MADINSAVSPPLTATEAAAQLRAGTLTSVALTQAVLARADELDERLGTYVTRFDVIALEAAEQADVDFAAGRDRGPLQGIPVGIKDILAMSEGPTTAQSLVLDPQWGAGKDSFVVARLKRGGAVITGKVTLMEFAAGAPDPTKLFPIPRNPWDLDTWPGGSSSGTGNGIAAGLFLAGIGTDTGGSIRLPAAFCGVSGLMPTYGRVSRSGCVPLSYSLDHVGPLARSALDCAVTLGVIAGHDPADPASVRRPVPDYLAGLDGDLSGIRIGIERDHHFPDSSDPAVEPAFDATCAALADLGATMVEVSVPLYQEGAVALLATIAGEMLAYHRSDLRDRWDEYNPGTRRAAALGAFVSGADYVQAQKVRRMVQRSLSRLYEDVDLIVMPTAGIAAPAFGEDFALDLDSIQTLLFTTFWNLVGNPVLAVPMGFNAAALPLGLQIAARPFEEGLALKAGHAYQRVSDWHLRLPPLSASGVRAPSPAVFSGGRGSGNQVITAHLASAGLTPTDFELALFEQTYPLYRASIDSLYSVDECRYGEPATVFFADETTQGD